MWPNRTRVSMMPHTFEAGMCVRGVWRQNTSGEALDEAEALQDQLSSHCACCHKDE